MFSILRPYIFSLDPEVAHDLAIKSLKANILPKSFFNVEDEEMLETNILGKTISWIGDINNMCASWIEASNIFGFKLHVSSPPQYKHLLEELNINQSNVEYFADPLEACVQSNLITTDVWTSMGFEREKIERLKTFERWIVDRRKIDAANKDVVFMHCLPAHRGEEVSADVIDGPQSVVWQEAENRLHFQKALLEYLIKINEA